MLRVWTENIINSINAFNANKQAIIDEAIADAVDIAKERNLNNAQTERLMDVMVSFAKDKIAEEDKFFNDLFSRGFVSEEDDDTAELAREQQGEVVYALDTETPRYAFEEDNSNTQF